MQSKESFSSSAERSEVDKPAQQREEGIKTNEQVIAENEVAAKEYAARARMFEERRQAILEKTNAQVEDQPQDSVDQDQDKLDESIDPSPELEDNKKANALKAQKNNPSLKRVLGRVAAGILLTGMIAGVVVPIVSNTNIGNDQPVRIEVEGKLPDDTNIMQDTGETEKDWKELTGVDAFDKTVDGTFDQRKDVGMNGEATRSAENPNGKFSDNSMAAPNILMQEYFGTDMENATIEQKALGVEFASYKQAETAAAILTQVKAKGFEGMDYIRAVEKIKGASDEERGAYQDMLKEVFENSEVGETTVGEIRQALKVAGQDETLADWHYYMNRATGKAEHNKVPTGGETKVLSFTYTEKTGTETTFYFLERCYNGFEVRKVVNTSTQEVTYEVTVYQITPNDDLEKKNTEAEKKNMGNEYTDQRGIDGNVTPGTTKQQDQQNFNQIEAQKKADAEKAKQDEAEKRRQQEAEKKAATESERVAAEQANKEAEEKAAAEAAEKQRQAAEAEKRQAAEEEARKKAQEEADRAAEEMRKAAEEASKNDETRDANDFKNGDFTLQQ